MLVSGGQGIMRSEVTYGVSRFARAGRFCCVRCCLFQAASVQLFRFFPLPFPPLLVDLVSIALVSISTDLVSVTVPGGWWPVAARRVAVEACVLCSWPVAQASLLAPESPPTLAGTISKLVYWRRV